MLINIPDIIPRFVYGRMFVADGNFKADHVWQKNSNDVWIWDGGGMAPRTDEYQAFLRHAIIRHTVRLFSFPLGGAGEVAGAGYHTFRAINEFSR